MILIIEVNSVTKIFVTEAFEANLQNKKCTLISVQL